MRLRIVADTAGIQAPFQHRHQHLQSSADACSNWKSLRNSAGSRAPFQPRRQCLQTFFPAKNPCSSLPPLRQNRRVLMSRCSSKPERHCDLGLERRRIRDAFKITAAKASLHCADSPANLYPGSSSTFFSSPTRYDKPCANLTCLCGTCQCVALEDGNSCFNDRLKILRQ